MSEGVSEGASIKKSKQGSSTTDAESESIVTSTKDVPTEKSSFTSITDIAQSNESQIIFQGREHREWKFGMGKSVKLEHGLIIVNPEKPLTLNPKESDVLTSTKNSQSLTEKESAKEDSSEKLTRRKSVFHKGNTGDYANHKGLPGENIISSSEVLSRIWGIQVENSDPKRSLDKDSSNKSSSEENADNRFNSRKDSDSDSSSATDSPKKEKGDKKKSSGSSSQTSSEESSSRKSSSEGRLYQTKKDPVHDDEETTDRHSDEDVHSRSTNSSSYSYSYSYTISYPSDLTEGETEASPIQSPKRNSKNEKKVKDLNRGADFTKGLAKCKKYGMPNVYVRVGSGQHNLHSPRSEAYPLSSTITISIDQTLGSCADDDESSCRCEEAGDSKSVQSAAVQERPETINIDISVDCPTDEHCVQTPRETIDKGTLAISIQQTQTEKLAKENQVTQVKMKKSNEYMNQEVQTLSLLMQEKPVQEVPVQVVASTQVHESITHPVPAPVVYQPPPQPPQPIFCPPAPSPQPIYYPAPQQVPPTQLEIYQTFEQQKKRKKCKPKNKRRSSEAQYAKDFLVGLVFLQRLIKATSESENNEQKPPPTQMPICWSICMPMMYNNPFYYQNCQCNQEPQEIPDDTNENSCEKEESCSEDEIDEPWNEPWNESDDEPWNACSENLVGIQTDQDCCFENANCQTENKCEEVRTLRGLKECFRIMTSCLEEFSDKPKTVPACEYPSTDEEEDCSSESEDSSESESDDSEEERTDSESDKDENPKKNLKIDSPTIGKSTVEKSTSSSSSSEEE